MRVNGILLVPSLCDVCSAVSSPVLKKNSYKTLMIRAKAPRINYL